MDEQVESYLEGERADGRLDSEGAFTISLEKAGAKLAEFGQDDPDLWTLKLIQAVVLLGYSQVGLRLTDDRWLLLCDGPGRAPDLQRLGGAVGALGLSEETTPESCLAAGLCSMAAGHKAGQTKLIAAGWFEQGRVQPIVGDRLGEVPPTGQGLLLKFPSGHRWPLPLALWKNRFAYGAIDFKLKTSSVSQSHVLNPPPALKNWDCTLQYLLHPARAGHLRLLSAEPARRLLSEALVARGAGAAKVGVRWEGRAQPDQRACAVLVSLTETSATEFYGVKGGCLMDPFSLFGFPAGMRLIFDAHDCATDLSGLNLRDTRDRRRAVQQCAGVAHEAMQHLLKALDGDAPLLEKPKTPLISHLTSAAGGATGALGILGAILEGSPALAAGISLLLCAPSAGLYIYGQKQRTAELEEQKRAARARLTQGLSKLEDLLRSETA